MGNLRGEVVVLEVIVRRRLIRFRGLQRLETR